MSRYYSDKAISLVAPKDTIGMIGALLGKANLETSVHPDEAIALVDRCQPLCKDFPSHYSYGQTMKALAYFFKNDPKSFFLLQEEYNTYKAANKLQDDQNDGIFQTINAVFTGNYEEAIRLIQDKSLYSENMGHFDMLIQLYQLRGDKNMVIRQLQRKINAVDSLNANFIHENMNEMNAEMEVYKAQQQVIRTRLYWLTAVVVLLIAIIALLFWRYFTRRRYQKKILQQNEQLEIALSEAKESDRMKTAFVQHISHEIRTPLNIITGFAQVVSNPDYELSKEDRNRIMADISHNTTEITNFVNELLELSESESQSVYQLDDDVDVPTICQEAIEASETANQGRLVLSVNSELPEGYRLKSNAAAIRKILDRLMSNALKFTVNGSVTIRLKSEKGQLKIEVEDTGKGIPHDQQERVFERFYKIDSFVQGMGLGLTVARRSAQLLGGTLTIDPTYTTGCRFVITLPENKQIGFKKVIS
jgi:signal transduction histidine kinase